MPLVCLPREDREPAAVRAAGQSGARPGTRPGQRLVPARGCGYRPQHPEPHQQPAGAQTDELCGPGAGVPCQDPRGAGKPRGAGRQPARGPRQAAPQPRKVRGRCPSAAGCPASCQDGEQSPRSAPPSAPQRRVQWVPSAHQTPRHTGAGPPGQQVRSRDSNPAPSAPKAQLHPLPPAPRGGAPTPGHVGAEGTSLAPNPGREPLPQPAPASAAPAQPGQPTRDTVAETRDRELLPLFRARGPTSWHRQGWVPVGVLFQVHRGQPPFCVLPWPLAGSAVSARVPSDQGPAPMASWGPAPLKPPLHTQSPWGLARAAARECEEPQPQRHCPKTPRPGNAQPETRHTH